MSTTDEGKRESANSGSMFLQEAAYLLQQLDSNWLELELEMAPLYSMSLFLPAVTIATEEEKVAVNAKTNESLVPNADHSHVQKSAHKAAPSAA